MVVRYVALRGVAFHLAGHFEALVGGQGSVGLDVNDVF
jgi:hypothetical protein